MSSESALWQMTGPRLKSFGFVRRIENRVDDGMPDLLYCLRWGANLPATGFLELKEDELPVRPGTIFRIASLTKDQVKWQNAWSAAGGRVWTLVQAGHLYLLFTPYHLEQIFRGRYTKTEAIEASPFVDRVGHFPTGKLIRCLTAN